MEEPTTASVSGTPGSRSSMLTPISSPCAFRESLEVAQLALVFLASQRRAAGRWEQGDCEFKKRHGIRFYSCPSEYVDLGFPAAGTDFIPAAPLPPRYARRKTLRTSSSSSFRKAHRILQS